MQLDIPDPVPVITAALVALAGIGKVYFKLRRDGQEVKAVDVQDSGYSHVLEQMRTELNRLANSLAIVSRDLDLEIKLRRQAQDENAALRVEIILLKDEVRRLRTELEKENRS